jgi:FkbM family methyltransferase
MKTQSLRDAIPTPTSSDREGLPFVRIGGRDTRKIAKAVFDRRHYLAASNMLRLYERPLEMFRRYLTRAGTYPCTVRVATPIGRIDLKLYAQDDVLTVNEIFCRADYQADVGDKVVVDFGSNIGISAAYFLSRGEGTFTYLFEPLPANIEHLRYNLRPFEGRYALEEVAVGTEEGEVQFGWEPTGRYGGVGLPTGNYIKVRCRRARDVLQEVVNRQGKIDILKIDIETMEEAVVGDIPSVLARHIDKVYVEFKFANNPLSETHSLRQRGPIAQFLRRTPSVEPSDT